MIRAIEYMRLRLREYLGMRGAAMTEYAIILGFIAVIAAVVFRYNYSTDAGGTNTYSIAVQLLYLKVRDLINSIFPFL